jgi:hypothetical protein
MQRLEVSGAVRHIYIYIYIYVIRRQRVNIPQSCLVTSDSIRHYQQLFPQAYFALLLLKLLYIRLYLSNNLGPSQATKQRTTDYIWVEKYFKKSF